MIHGGWCVVGALLAGVSLVCFGALPVMATTLECEADKQFGGTRHHTRGREGDCTGYLSQPSTRPNQSAAI